MSICKCWVVREKAINIEDDKELIHTMQLEPLMLQTVQTWRAHAISITTVNMQGKLWFLTANISCQFQVLSILRVDIVSRVVRTHWRMIQEILRHLKSVPDSCALQKGRLCLRHNYSDWTCEILKVDPQILNIAQLVASNICMRAILKPFQIQERVLRWARARLAKSDVLKCDCRTILKGCINLYDALEDYLLQSWQKSLFHYGALSSLMTCLWPFYFLKDHEKSRQQSTSSCLGSGRLS